LFINFNFSHHGILPPSGLSAKRTMA
jgi:hypothetical protein